MKSVWTSFSLAWKFLTILPLPGRTPIELSPRVLATSLGWYPFIGFLLGTVLMLANRLLSGTFSEATVNLVLLVILVILTGALHQDGLADSIDAIAGGRDREHRLSILKDGRIGAIGATGLILGLGLRFVSLLSLPPGSRESFLLCMPALGRWSMVLGAWMGTYPRREGGIGAPFIQHASWQEVFLASMVLAMGLFFAMGPIPSMIIMVSILLLVALLIWYSTRLIGGVTGDILGATNEMTEIVFVLAAPLLIAFA